MTFLLPVALAALVMVGLPIAIHLLRREEVRERDFPALRYFLSDARVRQQRLRLRELILLALRVGAVLLAVLAAARWVMPSGSGHLPPADVVVIIENGIVSGTVVDGRRVLDGQKELAAALLDRLGPPDRVWIMPTGSAHVPVFPVTPAEALVDLRSVEPVAEMAGGAGLAPGGEPGAATSHWSQWGTSPGPPHALPVERAVRRARNILEARPPTLQEIVVIRSDGARLPDSEGRSGEIPVREVDPGLELPENRGITSVEVNGGLVPRAGDPVTIDVQVRGTPPGGADLAAEVPVRLVLDGETLAAGRTDAGGRVQLTLAGLQEGWASGWVELDPDALRLDDRVPLAFPVVPPPTVRVLGDPGRWARTALVTLEEGGRIVLDAGPLPPGRMRSAIEALPPLPPGSALLVTGDLVVSLPPADPTLAARFNSFLEVVAPEGAEGAVWMAEPSAPGSFLEVAQVSGLPGSVVGTEIHRLYRLAGAGPDSGPDDSGRASDRGSAGGSVLDPDGSRPGGQRVMARLLDGTPWIVEVHPGRADDGDQTGLAAGRWTLRVLGSPLDPDWSDLPISAAMVPALERLLLPGTPVAQSGEARGPGAVPLPPAPVLSEGPPPAGWTREVLAERRGREAAPFLAWLIFVILCTEGWLAAGQRAGTRPDHETSTPP
ncbi:hypothetical protein BH23GEM11_BH23GEM11_02550 [soil metagenome]